MPATYDTNVEDDKPIDIVKKSMAGILDNAPVPNTIQVVKDSMTDMRAQGDEQVPYLTESAAPDGGEEDNLDQILSLLGISPTSDEDEDGETINSGSAETSSWSHKSKASGSAYAAYSGDDVLESAEQEAGYEVGDPAGDVPTSEMEALIAGTMGIAELAEVPADISAANVAPATAAAYHEDSSGDAVSSAAGDVAAATAVASHEDTFSDASSSSAAAGDAASSSAAAGDAASSSAAAGDAASSSAAAGDAVSSASSAGEASSFSSVLGYELGEEEEEEESSEVEYAGECVPFYLCKNDDIVIDSTTAELIDKRFGTDHESKSVPQCPHFLNVFCRLPLSEPDPEVDLEDLVDHE